jgi:amino acid transporter
VLALLVDINALAQLVSIGTLFVFFMVSAGVLQVRWQTTSRSIHFCQLF